MITNNICLCKWISAINAIHIYVTYVTKINKPMSKYPVFENLLVCKSKQRCWLVTGFLCRRFSYVPKHVALLLSFQNVPSVHPVITWRRSQLRGASSSRIFSRFREVSRQPQLLKWRPTRAWRTGSVLETSFHYISNNYRRSRHYFLKDSRRHWSDT